MSAREEADRVFYISLPERIELNLFSSGVRRELCLLRWRLLYRRPSARSVCACLATCFTLLARGANEHEFAGTRDPLLELGAADPKPLELPSSHLR